MNVGVVMKKLICFILLFIPIFTYAANENPIELFQQGNENFKKGKYNDAINFYESILNKNIKNGWAYYNLGNAYFKNNMLGKAILNYERAKIYLPNEKDIDYNLKFANSQILDKIDSEVSNPFTKIILFIYNLFDLNTLFWISYFIFILLITSLILKWYYKNHAFQVINDRIFNYLKYFFLVFIIILIIKIYDIKTATYGIILDKEVKIKSGPSDEYTDIFTLHEGSKVKLRKQSDKWLLIYLPNGYNGWVNNNSLEKI